MRPAIMSGERAAAIYTIIETAKLNGIERPISVTRSGGSPTGIRSTARTGDRFELQVATRTIRNFTIGLRS